MSSDIYKKVRANPRFAELTRKRNRLAVSLTALVLGTYYILMMLVAFAPDILRVPISSGATLTWIAPLGAAIIIGSWLLTGLYVARSNGEFDRIGNELIEGLRK